MHRTVFSDGGVAGYDIIHVAVTCTCIYLCMYIPVCCVCVIKYLYLTHLTGFVGFL